jgi:hypothetical protein
MTQDNRKRGRFNWGSLIGWLIFILVVAGGPLLNLLRRVLGAGASLPVNLSNLLPILIGGLVVLSIVVSAVRALNNSMRSSGDTRLPTSTSGQARPPSAPMPPFGGAQRLPQNLPSSPRAFTLPPGSRTANQPQPPQFEPLINPLILALGILGLLALGGAALFFFAQGGP